MSSASQQVLWWPAPLRVGPLNGVLEVPGSKSQTNRFLLLAATGQSKCRLRGCLWSRDTLLMRAGLEKLGASFLALPDGTIEVSPITTRVLREPVTIECGLAGTVMRFLPLLAVAFNVPITFTADVQANARPMQPIFEVLKRFGAKVTFSGGESFPFTVTGPLTTLPERIEVDCSLSSQFFSAVLLALPFLAESPGTFFIETVASPSHPHVAMTVATLKTFGHEVSLVSDSELKSLKATATITSQPTFNQRLPELIVEPDLSSAAPFIAAVAFAGGSLQLPAVPKTSTQVGIRFLEIVSELGLLTVSKTEDTQNCYYRVASLSTDFSTSPLEMNLTALGELTPILVALATLLPHETTFTGIGHLRGHETDRLTALEKELGKLGIECETGPDCLRVHPPAAPAVTRERSQPVKLNTYNDHRLAMFAALMGLRQPVLVENIGTTCKTMPNFERIWQELILGVENE
ncbi:3-phosphoshikimate 1-carboxyvinyltransferase [Gleimia coleocanis DSM 15436]|uniref:3-phosphoshikimate 1-carboxyvinyltransferase n=1 Tax=Gleimia coleocanis DSM 15436 TaxID=525245 RepID=C0VZX4_9ACTO|nr:3-phosphoshikimate 1-carboxyvinyltransferase [Gleimia coleocanis]EEH63833.1 3-phosphoshikimate 1-carboxyvinyltransferase [Gleimia coleocanis DSM 15436]